MVSHQSTFPKCIACSVIDHKHFSFSGAWFRTVSGHLSRLHPCKLNVKTSRLCSLTSFRGKEMALVKLQGIGFTLPHAQG